MLCKTGKQPDTQGNNSRKIYKAILFLCQICLWFVGKAVCNQRQELTIPNATRGRNAIRVCVLAEAPHMMFCLSAARRVPKLIETYWDKIRIPPRTCHSETHVNFKMEKLYIILHNRLTWSGHGFYFDIEDKVSFFLILPALFLTFSAFSPLHFFRVNSWELKSRSSQWNIYFSGSIPCYVFSFLAYTLECPLKSLQRAYCQRSPRQLCQPVWCPAFLLISIDGGMK